MRASAADAAASLIAMPRCPHCHGRIGLNRVRRWARKAAETAVREARVGRRHPDTSREAAAEVTASGRNVSRARLVKKYLRRYGPATDDEVDAHFQWGHQSTSAVMSNMRRAGMIEFSQKTRRTRKGRRARVNVLAVG